ncbi:TraB/GumN family protein [Pantoea sp. A4]|uniref:TraB/GumN family protein n=1 Tax=Pantoea sp. A4 TaxID=1225184 RepID=UPI0003608F65|nr:TraB/GumN family protein [Pantoea sp. A4]
MTVSLWQRLSALKMRLFPTQYRWPALDMLLGDRWLHLVGSIHMGTQNMQPLPPQLLRRLRQADALIVEADITRGGSPFTQDEQRPPLAERFPATTLAGLEKLLLSLPFSLSQLDNLPAWQIALMLQAQQAQQLGLRPEYGIDYQLLQAARDWHKPVIELEGADAQITLLKTLPDDGKALLLDTLEHWHTNARLLQMMMGWWLEHPPKQRQLALPTTFSQTLNDTLITQRNLQWKESLTALPGGRYVVAVGALHLYGDDNLPELLRQA